MGCGLLCEKSYINKFDKYKRFNGVFSGMLSAVARHLIVTGNVFLICAQYTRQLTNIVQWSSGARCTEKGRKRE